MITDNLFNQVAELTEKFKHFLRHNKKLKALENFSQVIPFYHKDYLLLIKRCLKTGFLDEQEAVFLNHMVDKYFVQYHFLDWTHRTPWLKQEMRQLQAEKIRKRPLQLDLLSLKKPNVPALPVALIDKSKAAAFFRKGA